MTKIPTLTRSNLYFDLLLLQEITLEDCIHFNISFDSEKFSNMKYKISGHTFCNLSHKNCDSDCEHFESLGIPF